MSKHKATAHWFSAKFDFALVNVRVYNASFIVFYNARQKYFPSEIYVQRTMCLYCLQLYVSYMNIWRHLKVL